MKFNDEAFIQEFANLVNKLDIKSALEVGCLSGELLEALHSMDIEVSGIDLNPQRKDVLKADIREINPKGKKKYDLVFSSGLLEHFPIGEIPEIIKNMASLSRKYILNYVPNKNCLAYKKAKAKTTAEWKNELDFDIPNFEELHKDAGLKIVKSGLAGAEWAKRFGPEPSEPYLVYALAKKAEAKVNET
jgi:cyclopropane fatty-acyl-phospholipid synthase-like methyltransferase